jgi:hypothetical protein
MPQFMLLLYETPGDFAKLSPDEIQKVIEKYSAWGQRMAESGKMVAGHKLTEDGGKRLPKGGTAAAATDGPYAETKEVVGGVYILRAKDFNEAVTLAVGCPHSQFGRIEVRQIDFMGQPET